MPAEIKTKRSNLKFRHDGFLFIFDKFVAEGEQIAWRCEKKDECKARIWTNQNNEVVRISDAIHTHDANPSNVISQQRVTALKRRAVETMEPPAMLRAVVMENVPSPVLHAIPNPAATKMIIKRARHEIEARPANPQSVADLEIPEKYQQYSRSENDPPEHYLLADSGLFNVDGDQRQHRILIFGRSVWWTNWAAQMTEIYVDGTFSIAPPLFHQLYVVLTRRGEWIFPAAFILLTGKSERIYSRMLQLIQGFAPQFNPQSVTIDYEEAAMNAFRTAFPNVQISGCYFHLMKNMRDKLGKRHLLHEYSTNPIFAENARMITSIAFVHPDYVPRAIQVVQQIVQGSQLESILQWFMKYYTGTSRADGTLTASRFPIDVWNLHLRTLNGEHRTNNVSEAAHRRLQSLFSCTHPTLWKFVEILWKEQKSRDADFSRYVAGVAPPPKQKKYRDADRRILKIFDRFTPQNIDEFLRGMARNCQIFH